MQKLSVSVLENMVKMKVTNKELDFILWTARYQNEYGIAQGIHYRELCEEVGLSVQAFYDCKKSLEEKGIISCVKNNYFDWDISIIDNSFVGKENYGRGYVNVHCNMVRSEAWTSCRSNAKLLALLLMREWNISKKHSGKASYQMLKSTFYMKFIGLFEVSKRVLRSYLGELKPFLNIYLEQNTKYYFSFLESAVSTTFTNEDGKRVFLDGENEEFRLHEIQMSCRRNRIKAVQEKLKKELNQLLIQHHKKIEKLLTFDFSEIIAESLAIINQNVKNKYKWKRVVNVPLVHKVLVASL